MDSNENMQPELVTISCASRQNDIQFELKLNESHFEGHVTRLLFSAFNFVQSLS